MILLPGASQPSCQEPDGFKSATGIMELPVVLSIPTHAYDLRNQDARRSPNDRACPRGTKSAHALPPPIGTCRCQPPGFLSGHAGPPRRLDFVNPCLQPIPASPFKCAFKEFERGSSSNRFLGSASGPADGGSCCRKACASR